MDIGGGHSHANHPSSSSRRLGAGNGAPGPSWFGSLTYPPSRNGFSACSLDKIGDDEDVLMGRSASRRDQPRLLIESRKEVDAMAGKWAMSNAAKVHGWIRDTKTKAGVGEDKEQELVPELVPELVDLAGQACLQSADGG